MFAVELGVGVVGLLWSLRKLWSLVLLFVLEVLLVRESRKDSNWIIMYTSAILAWDVLNAGK
jgi:hypothetical protein